MKRKILFAIIGLLVILGIIFFKRIMLNDVSWDDIQNVGGIKIEKPLMTEDGCYLPIICNISGLDSITHKPRTLNSALICAKTRVVIKGNKIYITVVDGLIGFNEGYRKCRATYLGKEPAHGHYFVYYKDKISDSNLVGEFDF